MLITGFMISIIKSITPDDLNAPIAKNIPRIVGNSLNTISIPSFAPSINVSKTLSFSINPYTIIMNIVNGTAVADK